MDVLNMVDQVFDPSKGSGSTETLIAVMLIIAFILALFFLADDARFDVVKIFAGLIVGFYFGNKTGIYSTK